MANNKQLSLLTRGVAAWNPWRVKNPTHQADLREAALRSAALAGANLHGANLQGADLREADLRGAILSEANLQGADLRRADLRRAGLREADLRRSNLRGSNLRGAYLGLAIMREANLHGANLRGSNLRECNLRAADLSGAGLRDADLQGAILIGSDLSAADLRGADLRGAVLDEANLHGATLDRADLRGASFAGSDLRAASLDHSDLRGALLVNTNLEGAALTGCRVLGISTWGSDLQRAIQADLVISDDGEPTLSVDNLEVAQLLHLLLNTEGAPAVVETMTSRLVLILGCGPAERGPLLDALRQELVAAGYIPVRLDAAPASSQDQNGVLRGMARLARFIIADISDPSAIPPDLESVVSELGIPVQALLHETQQPWGMFAAAPVTRDWLLPACSYAEDDDLPALVRAHVIPPAEARARELQHHAQRR